MSDPLRPYAPTGQLLPASDSRAFVTHRLNMDTFVETSSVCTCPSVYNSLPQTLHHSSYTQGSIFRAQNGEQVHAHSQDIVHFQNATITDKEEKLILRLSKEPIQGRLLRHQHSVELSIISHLLSALLPVILRQRFFNLQSSIIDVTLSQLDIK